MTSYYVLLTGSKNNAGDYLIKKRAIELLSTYRADRELVDFNAWEPVTDEGLERINAAKALILTGGPSLQRFMYPGVYALRRNLDDIRVPITTMGIGWKGFPGDWTETRRYALSKSTLELVHKINESGYLSSVRDYHTLNVLQHAGFDSFMMTGCPALYVKEFIGAKINQKLERGRVAFSVGVAFLVSRSIERQMKNLLAFLAQKYGRSNVAVLFHHSIDRRLLSISHSNWRQRSGRARFLRGQLRFVQWLERNGYQYRDVSDSADRMIEEYVKADLHVGYRVHAHILMSSISKPSILLAEDGRGKALKEVLCAPVIDAFDAACDSRVCAVLKKVRIVDPFSVSTEVDKEVAFRLGNEEGHQFACVERARASIDATFSSMLRFMKQLP